ncbi:MAG: ATP-binding protein, partial [Candidatus Zixiibacteriota bacterium]
LDDASKVILIINIISIIVIALVYFTLYRFILSPFRKIKKQAMDAGRVVPTGEDDVEAMVDEYQKIIGELKEKENELIILNKAIQKKADSLEQFNKYLMKSMSSGIITVNKQGEIMSVNNAAEHILQIDSNNYSGKHFKELFHINVSMVESINIALQNNQNHPYREYVIKVSDSLSLNLGVIISVIHDNTDNPIGASILLNDLTEIKKLRRDLETKTRLVALGEMAGGLAHQLRNSIGAILGYSCLLKKRLLKKNLETGSLDALEEETKEAELLIDRFLQFARPSNFYPQKTNINSLIKEVIEKFKIREDFQYCDFVLNEKNFENTEAEIDSLLIKQALANIIENGVNAYCGQEGAIELNLSTTQDSAIIEIKDFGCGIKEENLDKIFTPFFSSRPSGTGLGLSLAKKIIDLHQGRLSVFSEPERGTSFTIYLPIQQNKKEKNKLEEMTSF